MQTVENRFIAVIAVIYAVGIAGFMIPSLNALFMWLTPINILATFVIAWIFHKKWEFNHVLMILIIGIIGFFIELAGVKTQAIFGSYLYGKTLGAKWQGVPYLIGVNWAAMIFYTSSLLAGRIKNNLGVAFLGALIMTIYDYFLEPVAVKYDFWHWKNGIIPLQNYFVWFIVAFVMHLILNAACKPIKNRMATALLFIQMAFFLILHIYIRLF
jgi:putative membrane protein